FPPENLEAEIINTNDVQLTWDAPSGKDLLGYNIYRNNENIDNTTETNYDDENLEPGTYEYYITALYSDGESVPSAPASVLIGGSSLTLFEDDFDTYAANQQLVCQNSVDWTTWSNAPCGNEDPYITTAEAYSGSNSFVVEGVNDLVKVIENYTSGLYKISFYMYVPSGFLGYFNTLQDFAGANSSWGMQVFFNDDGTGSIDGGVQTAATFSFQNNTWLYNEVIVDLNNDWAEYILDGNSIHSWVWSIGAFGQSNMNQLGGSNFYAWDGTTKGTPKYYIDDYKLEELIVNQLLPPTNFAISPVGNDFLLTWNEPDGKGLLGYNIYYSTGGGFTIVAFVTDPEYLIESPGAGMHQYYITALYDEGESDPTNIIEFVITDIDESLLSESKIYPNPATDFVNISSEFEIKTVKIFNYAGQVMTVEQVKSTHYRINTSQYNPGIYFLRIETTAGIISKRIIIE
ncbi:MAG: T9SS type A sorting domain-containing protein, partial [Bacteroidales bacterium]|nr:T9SS type A sorting domain-containing protein [Bacteroidales bacterium]